MHSLLKSPVLATILSLSFVGPALAQNAYITNQNSNNVSVIDTATNTVVATVSVGAGPFGVAVSPNGTKAYITNTNNGTVSVIDTSTNTVTATINVGSSPLGVAITPDGSKVYVANDASANVSVINTSTNTVSTTISLGSPGAPNPVGIAVSPDGSLVYVGGGTPGGVPNFVYVIATATDTLTGSINIGINACPYQIAFTPDGSKAYVARSCFGDVAVINPATSMVTGMIATGLNDVGLAISPDGATLYVSNLDGSTVSVVNTATNMVTSTIPTNSPFGISITPDGSRVYVANPRVNTVSVIDTGTNTVTGTIPVGSNPPAFGTFIQQLPAFPAFAGTPGTKNCHGTVVSALATKFGGLNNAAAAFGFAKVQGLQDAIRAFCGN